MDKPFLEARTRVVGELSTLPKDLAAAQGTLDTARRVTADAKAEMDALGRRIATTIGSEPLSAAIVGIIEAARQKYRDAAGTALRAQQDVDAIERQIADAQDALRQLDRLLRPAPAVVVALPAPRRQIPSPGSVDDNIEMPRGDRA